MRTQRILAGIALFALAGGGSARAQEPVEPLEREAVPLERVQEESRGETSRILEDLRRALDQMRDQEREIRQRLQELERSMPRLPEVPEWGPEDLPFRNRAGRAYGFPELSELFERLPRADLQGQSLVLKQEADGKVRVEIRRRGPEGEEQVQSFEAATLEEFKQKYPEVVQRYGLDIQDGAFHLRLGPGMGGWATDLADMYRPFVERYAAPRPMAPAPDATDRLGVYVDQVEPELAQEFGLEAGQGLSVQMVTPGSLAERLGLRAGDVLLSINDKPITSVETVQQELRRLRPRDTVAVVVGRSGGERVTLEAPKAPPRARRERL